MNSPAHDGVFFKFSSVRNMTSKEIGVEIALSDDELVGDFTAVRGEFCAPLLFFRVEHEPVVNPFAQNNFS